MPEGPLLHIRGRVSIDLAATFEMGIETHEAVGYKKRLCLRCIDPIVTRGKADDTSPIFAEKCRDIKNAVHKSDIGMLSPAKLSQNF